MQPKLTYEEYAELQRLLGIVNDKTKMPGERRIAMAKFDKLYSEAYKRSINQQPQVLQHAN